MQFILPFGGFTRGGAETLAATLDQMLFTQTKQLRMFATTKPNG